MSEKHSPATPLPWVIDSKDIGTPYTIESAANDEHVCLCGEVRQMPTWEERNALRVQNAQYIVLAANAFPALVDLLERGLDIAKDIDCVSQETVYCFVDDAEKLLKLAKGE